MGADVNWYGAARWMAEKDSSTPAQRRIGKLSYWLGELNNKFLTLRTIPQDKQAAIQELSNMNQQDLDKNINNSAGSNFQNMVLLEADLRTAIDFQNDTREKIQKWRGC